MDLSNEDIEAIADRVVELLRERSPGGGAPSGSLVDAATLARLLGVSRATVYANADQLGAIRLGAGKRARLRFDPARLTARRGTREPTMTPDRATNRVSRSTRPAHAHAPLLPIRSARVGTGARRSDALGRS